MGGQTPGYQFPHLGEEFRLLMDRIDAVIDGETEAAVWIVPRGALMTPAPRYAYGKPQEDSPLIRAREFQLAPFIVLGRYIPLPPAAVTRQVGRAHRMAVNLLRLAHAAAASQDWEVLREPYVGLGQLLPAGVALENEINRIHDASEPDREKLKAALRDVMVTVLPRTHDELRVWVTDRVAPAAGPTVKPTPTRKPQARGVKGRHINALMLEVMEKNKESLGWSCQQWADHLNCAPSTVVGTKAWGTLKGVHARLKVQRMERLDRSPGRAKSRRRK